MKNSSSSVEECKICGCTFPRKILLILHQKHEHSNEEEGNEAENVMRRMQDEKKGNPGKDSREGRNQRPDTHDINIYEMEALEFTSCSSETSEGSSDQESNKNVGCGGEPKAEPSANFLDHVVTRLSRGKKKVTYSCNSCGQDLQSMAQVKQHVPLHIGYSHFPCDRPTCPKSFSSVYDQLRHQDRHAAKERKKRARSNTNSRRTPTHINDSSRDTTVITGVIESDPRDFYLGPRYCLCNNFSYGDMVACDRKGCPLEWFHFECVGLKSKPRGIWYCPPCQARYKRKRMTSRSSRVTLESAEA